jgi:probable regulatory domain-containing protein
MIEVQPQSAQREIEALVLRVFLKTIDLVGGPLALAERRHLTWANSLMSASYIVVLHEEALKSADEIAAYLGVSRATVQNVLRADPELALKKVADLAAGEGIRVHLAGGLAKAAYRMVRQGQEEPRVLGYFLERFVELFDIPWAYLVLKAVKGFDFPANKPEDLLPRFQGLKLGGIPAEEIVRTLDYPIENPAELLRQVKMHLAGR